MARPALSSSALEARGAFALNPNRKRSDPVDERGIGPAPSHMSVDLCAAWDEIVGNTIPGTLGQADRLAVEVCARLLLKIRTGEATAGEMSLFTNTLGKMGCLPADRNRITIKKKAAGNAFADI